MKKKNCNGGNMAHLPLQIASETKPDEKRRDVVVKMGHGLLKGIWRLYFPSFPIIGLIHGRRKVSGSFIEGFVVMLRFYLTCFSMHIFKKNNES